MTDKSDFRLDPFAGGAKALSPETAKDISRMPNLSDAIALLEEASTLLKPMAKTSRLAPKVADVVAWQEKLDAFKRNLLESLPPPYHPNTACRVLRPGVPGRWVGYGPVDPQLAALKHAERYFTDGDNQVEVCDCNKKDQPSVIYSIRRSARYSVAGQPPGAPQPPPSPITPIDPNTRRLAPSRLYLSEALMAALSNQLWRYFDIDFDVQQIAGMGHDGYRLFGAALDWPSAYIDVRFKITSDGHGARDLYLRKGGEYVGPTTTPEQQAER